MPYVVAVSANYLENLRCEVVHEESGSRFETVAPKDNQGDGSTFSPTDLVGTSLLSCMMTIISIAARRDGIDIAGLKGRVEKTMSQSGPRRIGKLDVVLTLPAHLDDEQMQKMARAAETCPVKRSLHPEVQVNITYERA